MLPKADIKAEPLIEDIVFQQHVLQVLAARLAV